MTILAHLQIRAISSSSTSNTHRSRLDLYIFRLPLYDALGSFGVPVVLCNRCGTILDKTTLTVFKKLKSGYLSMAFSRRNTQCIEPTVPQIEPKPIEDVEPRR